MSLGLGPVLPAYTPYVSVCLKAWFSWPTLCFSCGSCYGYFTLWRERWLAIGRVLDCMDSVSLGIEKTVHRNQTKHKIRPKQTKHMDGQDFTRYVVRAYSWKILSIEVLSVFGFCFPRHVHMIIYII